MRVILLGSIWALCLAFAGQAQADPTAKEIVTHYRNHNVPDQKLISYYVSGVAASMIWMNEEANHKFGRKLYCAPNEVQQSTSSFMQFVTKYLEANPSLNDFPFGAVAAEALIDKFPCK
jgi:hypothetical protein